MLKTTSSLLGAFAKFRKATISYVMCARMSVRLSVRLSVHMEQIGSHWTDFHVICYFTIFERICLENSSFIKIGKQKKVLDMKTDTHF
jgi:hypothetical protein